MQLIRTNRDLRVDFFRGLALWWIFVDHIGANYLNRFSLHNFALCDATEVFVLLAGYAAGIAYGRTMTRQGYFYAAADIIRRAWVLYVAHIFLFVVFTAQVAYSAAALNRADYLDEIHLNFIGEIPYRSMFEALTLGFQPSYLNILPLYIALLLLFVPGLALLKRPPLLAVCSFALYAAARLFELDLPSWTGEGWYFNPLTWQLLFMSGAILSYAPGEPFRRRRLMDGLAIIVVAFGAVEKWFIFGHPGLTANLPLPITRAFISIDKEGLHPMRLISILAFAWLVSRWIPKTARWLQRPVVNGFTLCGQHSLPVFCGGIFLSFLGRLGFEYRDGWYMQVGINVVGALLLVMIAVIAAWYDAKGRLPKPPKEAVTVAAVLACLVIPAYAAHAETAPSVAAPVMKVAAPVMKVEAPRPLKPAPVIPAPVAPMNVTPIICPPIPSLSDDGDPMSNLVHGVKSRRLSILAIGSGAMSTQPNGKGSSFYEMFLAELRKALPDVDISVVVRGAKGMTASSMLRRMPAQLTKAAPNLVIWQTGTADAIGGVPPDDFAETLMEGAERIQDAGADLILVDQPFSRYLDANADLSDYAPAFRDVAALPGAVLFPRHQIMRDWAQTGALDIEGDRAARSSLKQVMHACLSRALVQQILNDLK